MDGEKCNFLFLVRALSTSEGNEGVHTNMLLEPAFFLHCYKFHADKHAPSDVFQNAASNTAVTLKKKVVLPSTLVMCGSAEKA